MDEHRDEYKIALVLVQAIDDCLDKKLHFRDVDGTVLLTLDEVVLAIKEKRWIAPTWFYDGESTYAAI